MKCPVPKEENVDSVVPETKQRTFVINNKKQLIIAVKCCIGIYDAETIINYGKNTVYRFKFHNSIPICNINERKRLYDKRLREIISKIKRTKL